MEPTHQSKTLFLIFLGLLIIIVGLFIIDTRARKNQTASQSKPTENWKTYHNPDLLLSFKYPEDSQLKETTSSKVSSVILTAPNYSIQVTTWIQPNANLTALSQTEYNQLNSCPNENKDFPLDSTPIGDNKLAFPGFITKYYSYRNCQVDDSKYYFVHFLSNKDHVYAINIAIDPYVSDDCSFDECEDLIYQIFSTFKFSD